MLEGFSPSVQGGENSLFSRCGAGRVGVLRLRIAVGFANGNVSLRMTRMGFQGNSSWKREMGVLRPG